MVCPHNYARFSVDTNTLAGRYRLTKLSASLLIEHEGKLMMVEEACDKYRGKWSQPQGMIELNETPEEAAIREAKEETGLTVELVNHFATYVCTKDLVYMINFCFRARPVLLEQAPLHADILSARWYDPAELVQLSNKGHLRSDLTLRRITDWLSSRNSSVPSLGFIEIPALA